MHQKGCYKELDMGVQRCKWAAEFSGDEVCHKKRKLPAGASIHATNFRAVISALQAAAVSNICGLMEMGDILRITTKSQLVPGRGCVVKLPVYSIGIHDAYRCVYI